MPEGVYTRQDFRLWWLLIWTKDTISQARQKELAQMDISFIGAGTLFAIKALGSRATPTEISHWHFRKFNSTSALLNRMEKKGLIRKVNDLGKKNLIRVELTEKGEQVYNSVAKGESIRHIMTSLSEKERHHLISCLDKLRGRAFKELGIVSSGSFGYNK